MTETSSKRVAHFTGIYRCSNDGQTVFAGIGQLMKPCSCGGTWLFFPTENEIDKITRTVYLNPLEAIEMDRLPNLGGTINLIGGLNKYNGAFLVNEINPWRGVLGEFPCLEVTPVGPFDPELPAYKVEIVAC